MGSSSRAAAKTASAVGCVRLSCMMRNTSSRCGVILSPSARKRSTSLVGVNMGPTITTPVSYQQSLLTRIQLSERLRCYPYGDAVGSESSTDLSARRLAHEALEVARVGRRVLSAHLGTAPTAGGVALVLDSRGRLLLTLARYRRGWNFPGGFCSPGEDPIEGITRELQEEIGYPVDAPPLQLVHRSARRHHLEHFLMVEVPDDIAVRLHTTSWELRGAKWCGPHELPRLDPWTRRLLSDGEGVVSQLADRWIPGPTAAPLMAAHRTTQVLTTGSHRGIVTA
jgi:8-oxo-dGTP pyrophosphatase MutT (NUDIX family)